MIKTLILTLLKLTAQKKIKWYYCNEDNAYYTFVDSRIFRFSNCIFYYGLCDTENFKLNIYKKDDEYKVMNLLHSEIKSFNCEPKRTVDEIFDILKRVD